MTTPYVKHPVGNKLFVIEWELDVVGGVGAVGEKFEAIDAIPLSLTAVSPAGLAVLLSFGNGTNSNPAINISETVVLPLPWPSTGIEPPQTPKPVMPPPVRFWAVSADADGLNDGQARVGILFKEV